MVHLFYFVNFLYHSIFKQDKLRPSLLMLSIKYKIEAYVLMCNLTIESQASSVSQCLVEQGLC